MSLISADLLATKLDDPAIRIVDTRWYLADVEQGRREYEVAHIPGAVFLDVEDDLSTPGNGAGRHPLPDWSAFARRLGAAGIDRHHAVVAYDAVDGSIAARLWWMLRRLGHESVLVLDGGWGAWTRLGMPVEEAIPRYPPTSYHAAVQQGGVIDRDELRRALGEVVLLDARAPERYEGITEPVDPIAGHIPTAVNAFHGGNVTADGHFKSPDNLRARFESLGARGDLPAVTYCGSGVTSCHNILAMHLAGLPEPTLYPGSWSDWSTEGYPVATGAEPGEVPAQ
jgi:thiosulfate/3-mercaptopyruvate sulfurtransferase